MSSCSSGVAKPIITDHFGPFRSRSLGTVPCSGEVSWLGSGAASSQLVLLRVRLDVSQRLQDSLWDGRGSGQVVTDGDEAVLVGDVGDGYPCAVWGGVAVASLSHLCLLLGVSKVLDVALLLRLDLVTGLVPRT